MKIFFTWTILILPMLVGAEALTKEWRVIEAFDYKWRADSAVYSFVLSVPVDYDAAGDATRLEIFHEGKPVFVMNDNDGISKYSDQLYAEQLKKIGKNAIHSKYLFASQEIKNTSQNPLIMVFGWAYASSPGSFHVIILGDNGTPSEILNLVNFRIFDVLDLNKDGLPEITGSKCMSERWGHDLLTYAPYSVYKFGNKADSPMVLDMILSKEFNEQHYYGWTGIDCDENIAIVLHPPGGGKPMLMDAEKAEALFKAPSVHP